MVRSRRVVVVVSSLLLVLVHVSDGYVPNRTLVTLDVLGDGRTQLDLDLDHMPGEEDEEDEANVIQRRQDQEEDYRVFSTPAVLRTKQ